jgi:hypothetical protein
MTRKTPSPTIAPSLRTNDTNENRSAAEYSSGGRTTPRMISESGSSRGMPGMNEAAARRR